MDRLTDRLDDVAQILADTRRALLAVQPATAVLGADTGGLPGRLGRALHDRWVAVLTARAREAVDTAGRVGELADALRTTAERYAETDDRAARRLRREP